MNDELRVKNALRDWIAGKGKIKSEELNDQTPFVEQRIISSVQLMELILFIEDLSGQTIDVKSLKKGMLRDLNAIYTNFFSSADSGS